MKRVVFLVAWAAAILSLGLSAAARASAPSATPGLIADARLGNNTEGTTFVPSGPHANHLVMIDGWDVRAIPVRGNGLAKAKTLFSVGNLNFGAFPSGIAYIPTERNYLLSDQGDRDTIQAVSGKGAPLPARSVTYLPGTPLPLQSVEGLVFVPPASVARAVLLGDGTPSIEVMGLDGTVTQEIAIPDLAGSDITGLALLPSGDFLVSTADQNLWRVSPSGALVAGPIAVDGASDVEGLTALPDGSVFAADYTAGKLWAFNSLLQREPARDRNIAIGLGVSRANAGVWDPATGTYLVNAIGRDGGLEVAAVTPTLDHARVLFPLPGVFFGLSQGPGDTLAACDYYGRAVALFSRTGTIVSTLKLSTVAGLPGRRCNMVAYLPGADEYALRIAKPGFGHTIFVVRSDGTLEGSLDVPAGFTALATTVAGDRILAYAPGILSAFDEHGIPLGTTSVGPGPLHAPMGYAPGPGDAYALFDDSNSEVATFG